MRTYFSVVVAANAMERNPISKVVDLLRDMQHKIEADGKAESKVYDKYACWCATTTERKKDEISDHKSSIASLSNEILELKAVIATRENDIRSLEADISGNEQSMKQATVLRQNENKAFQAETGEMQSAIGNLEQAIRVLSGAGTGGAALLEVASVVERIAKKSASPGALLQQVAKLRYAPQSASVQGILKDMYDTFVINLEAMNAEEASSQHQFEQLMSTKTSQNKEWRANVEHQSIEKAEAEDTLGSNSESRNQELEELEAAQTFFADTAANCKAKADEWAERSRNRDEEMAGINQAIEILDDPEARKLFSSATATFAQVNTHSSEQASAERLYSVLSRAAKSSRSAQLAVLAVQVRRSGMGGHFDAVVVLIDNLIKILKKEEVQDAADLDNCKKQQTENTHALQDLDYEIKKLNNAINKLKFRKEHMEEDIAKTQDSIEKQTQIMEDAMEQRNEDHADFLQAKQDDETAIALIKSAKEALTRFYKNNNVALQAPEFAISKDQAPDATLSGTGNHKQEKNGIVAIMDQVRENMEAEVAEGVKTEAAELAAFEKQRGEDRQLMDTLNAHLAELQANVADDSAEILSLEQKLGNEQTERDAVADILRSLKTGCDWIRGNFDRRRENRAVEVKNLMDGKAMIIGGQPAGFLQK
jgi:septal ring factor EnvC (AmiA/AmiB activator)